LIFFAIFMDIIERLQKIIEHENLSVSAFARKIGVVDQTIRGIVVQKRNKPSFDMLVKILQTFDWLSAEWLIMGKGSMEKTKPTEKTDDSQQLIEFMKYLREKDEKIELLIKEMTELKAKYDIVSKKLEK
jgi:plasmid maintenance system antidote protein VapI